MNTAPPARRTRRRILMTGATGAIAALALAGCAPAAEPADDGPVELTFLNQSRGQEAALIQLAEQYTEETGVVVTVESPGPADYLPKLQGQAQSNAMPDIYSSFSATDMAPFYRAGWAMDLTEELDDGWADLFSPTIIELSRFEDGNNLDVPAGIYTVHWETQTYGIMINPELTGTTTDTAPSDVDELISVLQDSGADFSVAASLTPLLLQGLASNWLTDEEIEATLNGEASWESDGWRQAFQVLVDLTESGVVANDALPGGQDDNPNVETAFFTQELGAVFDASPGVSVGFRTNPEFDDYYSIPIPAAAGATLDARSPGVPGKGAVINPRGDHPEEALAFVKWLTEPEQQAVFAEVGRILPSNPELLESGDVPQSLTGYAAGVDTMQVMTTSFATDVRTAVVAEAQRVVLGEATVDEALANIQAAQDRVS
ncbi:MULTISPECIES: ABC transporter substrate-binding protein [unclassified Microbacterium]|uniref:ABC transporter substrate-binding protein n=1 Tax=Microbacterium TaxID=33882 RepID=UPI003B9FD384